MLWMLALSLSVASDSSAVVEWLRANSLPLKTVEAGNGFEDLEPFGKSLKGVRIVGMGEPTHGTREAFQFKHRMFEYLVERVGYRIFGIEASFPDCLPIERYIQTGVGDAEAVVHGQGFWTWDTEEVLGLVQWMREYNKSHEDKVHFVGFDMQVGAPAYARALDYFRTWRPADAKSLTADKPTASDFSKMVAILDKDRVYLTQKSGAQDFDIARQCAVVAVQDSQLEEGSGSVEAMNKAESKAVDDVKLLGKAGWTSKTLDKFLKQIDDGTASPGETQRDIESIKADLRTSPKESESVSTDLIRDLEELDRQYGPVMAALGRRDKFMAENVDWMLRKIYPSAKAMLWAHNYHIGSSVPADNAVDTMGRHLARRFGKAYFPIGFCFGEGSFQSRLQKPDGSTGPLQAFELGPPATGSFEEPFDKAGQLYLSIFDNAPKDVRQWLDQRHPARSCGALYDPKSPESLIRNDSLGKWFRGMVYLGKTTRARPLELTRERYGIKKDW